MSKLGKKLIKSMKEAVEITKNKVPAGRLVCDGKHWIAEDGTKFDTIDEMCDYDAKKRKEKIKKLPLEKQKAIKEKEKKRLQKWKEDEKKFEEKMAKQRYKRKFADVDTWSISDWFCDVVPKMIEQLVKNKHGWQPQLGYKIEKGKLVKLKKVKMEHPHSKKMVMMYPDITFEDEQKVLKYLADKIKKIVELDSYDALPKKFTAKDVIKNQKELIKTKDEALKLFSDIFFSLGD